MSDIYHRAHWNYPNQGHPEPPDPEHSFDELLATDVGQSIWGLAIQEQQAQEANAMERWMNRWDEHEWNNQ